MRSLVIGFAGSDRLHDFTKAWNAPFPCETFAAIDGKEVVKPETWKHPLGWYGLNMSLLELFIKAMKEGQSEPFAVFQDDCLFSDGWWEDAEKSIAEAPRGWWTINLGPHVGDAHLNPVPVSGNLVRLRHAWRTHAIIVNPAKLAELVYGITSQTWPDDQIWCDLMIKGAQQFYANPKFLVGTRPGTSMCSGKRWFSWCGPYGMKGPIHSSLAARQNTGFLHDWFSRNVPHLEVWAKGIRFKNALEIGSFEGRSACWLLETCCDNLTCLDSWKTDWYGHGPVLLQGVEDRFDNNIKRFGNRIKKIKGWSSAELPKLTDTYDFIYVDGDHEASSVTSDASMAWRLLQPGGVMLLDDYGWELEGCKVPPKIGIDFFLKSVEDETEEVKFSPKSDDPISFPQQVWVVKKK